MFLAIRTEPVGTLTILESFYRSRRKRYHLSGLGRYGGVRGTVTGSALHIGSRRQTGTTARLPPQKDGCNSRSLFGIPIPTASGSCNCISYGGTKKQCHLASPLVPGVYCNAITSKALHSQVEPVTLNPGIYVFEGAVRRLVTVTDIHVNGNGVTLVFTSHPRTYPNSYPNTMSAMTS